MANQLLMTTRRLLLDTNIVSYIMRGALIMKHYEQHLSGHTLGVSFITVGELYYGAENANWGQKRWGRLEDSLSDLFVIGYDKNVAYCYGFLMAERQRIGQPMGRNDAWIAACAIRHSIPLVTHNAKDFSNISGLNVISEIV